MANLKDLELAEAIAVLRDLKHRLPTANKAEIEAAFVQVASVQKERSVYVGKNYAIRFSEANTGSFSNSVMSLSRLKKYDSLPMVICIVRPNNIEFRLGNAHRLEDLSFDLPAGGRLVVDIKTKLLDRASAPKAYNIDKTLRTLAEPGSVFCLFFVGLDASRDLVRSHLVSIFDPIVLAASYYFRTSYSGCTVGPR